MDNVETAGFTRGWLRGLAFCLLLLAGSARAATFDFVVAQDGSGDFTTVQAAIVAVPEHQAARTRILIKAGTYKEKISVPKTKLGLTLVGEDRDTTILTYDDHATINPDLTVTGTEESPSVCIHSKDFAARNLTFANTAGDVGPAIALWVKGNRSHFRHCAFIGYQDTLCLNSKYAYFKNCYIEGAVDFIFGRSTAIFQGCTIHSVGYGYLTAADQRKNVSYGYVFKHCTIQGDAGPASVYLGRPWGIYAKVVYTDCEMDDSIVPEGWDDWGDPATHDTAFFAEYNTTGDGADPADRVEWSHQLSDAQNAELTPANLFKLPVVADDAKLLVAAPTPWYNIY